MSVRGIGSSAAEEAEEEEGFEQQFPILMVEI